MQILADLVSVPSDAYAHQVKNKTMKKYSYKQYLKTDLKPNWSLLDPFLSIFEDAYVKHIKPNCSKLFGLEETMDPNLHKLYAKHLKAYWSMVFSDSETTVQELLKDGTGDNSDDDDDDDDNNSNDNSSHIHLTTEDEKILKILVQRLQLINNGYGDSLEIPGSTILICPTLFEDMLDWLAEVENVMANVSKFSAYLISYFLLRLL